MYPQGMSRIPPFPSRLLLLLILSHQLLPILSLGPASVHKAGAEVILLECLPHQSLLCQTHQVASIPLMYKPAVAGRLFWIGCVSPPGASSELLTLSPSPSVLVTLASKAPGTPCLRNFPVTLSSPWESLLLGHTHDGLSKSYIFPENLTLTTHFNIFISSWVLLSL